MSAEAAGAGGSTSNMTSSLQWLGPGWDGQLMLGLGRVLSQVL